MSRSALFPDNFIWGTATAAFQIEGAVREGGRGGSIWDSFTRIPGKIRYGENADRACDHYHRLEEDLDLIAGLVPHYRFSIAWPRILPNGTGAVNAEGIAFYNRLIDGLLARGVTPWVTMYHWDLPQALQDQGGWQNRAMLDWFREYAAILVSAFGDRVRNWIILNEPGVQSWLGHGLGVHAPGLASEEAYLRSAHMMNLVIGQTYRQLKAFDPALNVGSAYTLVPIRGEAPDTDPAAVAALEGFWNTNFFDPLFLGRYPDRFAAFFAPHVQSGDLALCRAALDFVGVQHYNAIEAKADDARVFGAFFGAKDPATPKTDYGWTIDPEAFGDALTWLGRTYAPPMPVIVTENGAAFFDAKEGDACDDPRRVAFLAGYIGAMRRAMDLGCDIRGYFVWSLMDNFEWADGYTYRFGLIFVDYERNCARIPKTSYSWYRDLARRNELQMEPDQGRKRA